MADNPASGSARDTAAVTLSPNEATALVAACAADEPCTSDEIAELSGLGPSQARSASEFLRTKGALEVASEEKLRSVTLSDVGLSYQDHGHPRARLLKHAANADGVAPNDLRSAIDVDPAEAGAALGWLKQNGLLVAGKDGLMRAASEPLSEKAAAAQAQLEWLKALLTRLAESGSEPVSFEHLSDQESALVEAESRKRGKDRGPFRLNETTQRRYHTSAQGRSLLGQARTVIEAAKREIAQLSSEHLRDGSWRDRPFRRYSIGLKPSRAVAGRRHPYREFLDGAKRSLIGLGFEEMAGSLVENEFWNMDALFMPQFHPARAIHDAYFVAQPTHAKEIEAPFLDRVAAAHRDGGDTGSAGWGYEFDEERTRRLLLRSQGTALSARRLSTKPRVPGKYFGIARCFRCDCVDATHAPDFFQVEGIVLGETISLRHLMGLLKIFALEMARSEEVRFAPTYFPFTEPSVEIHMKHPRLGWVELGGAGIFRPELTRPLGVDVPVIAWGLGLDRMAMVALGINDIRELFSSDLEGIRARKLLPT